MGDRKIKEAIETLSGAKTDSLVAIVCTVDSVNADASTCDCTALDGRPFPDVLLMSSVEDGMLLLPVLGSIVTVVFAKYTAPFVAQFSAIDKAIVSAGSGIQFNDGSLGGLVAVQALTTKLNNLENLVNNFISLYNAHIHPATSGATSPTVSQETGTLTPTVRADIENTSVSHGS